MNRGDLLIANLKLPRQLPARDLRGDVGALRNDVLKASRGVGLRRKLKALSADDKRGAIRSGYRQIAIARVDFRNIHQIRKLVQQLLPLIDERARIVIRRLRGADLCVRSGDLRRQRVDLADRLRNVQVHARLKPGQICRCLVKGCRQILGGRQNRLPHVQIAWAGRKLGETVKESG